MHIILIGFMGAGKTTVGKELAEKLGFPFYDTDQLIEAQMEMSVSNIFSKFGEDKFRSLETEILKGSWTQEENWVLSVGGGLPMKAENQALLKQIGIVVYLRVKTDTVLLRLKGDTTRPLLKGDNAREKADSLLEYRGPFYEAGAELVVDADEKGVEEICEEIIARTASCSK